MNPIRYERFEDERGVGLGVAITVKGELWRRAVLINDDEEASSVASKLHTLANWIEAKIA